MARSMNMAPGDASIAKGLSRNDGDWRADLSDAADDAPFEIETDVERRFLKLTVRGEWDDAVFKAYAEAYLKAVAIFKPLGGPRYVLTDATGYGLLTPEMAERTSALVRSVEHEPAERGAIVTNSVVNQAQSRDICSERGTRYFRKVSQAMIWLFSEEA